ncbi:hypothetical protein QQF64_025664, partial [Cirrhinus molitorella]
KEKDLQELIEVVESHKRSAQTAVEDSERIFTELIHFIEKRRSESLPSVSLYRSSEGFTISSCLTFDDVVKLVSQLRDKLQKFSSETIEKISFSVQTVQIQ